MKYILLFLISFTLYAQDEIKLWQKLDAVGTCATLESPTIYMQEQDCKNAHGDCAFLTVNCAYAKLSQREVDDLEKPIFEVVETSCEESEDQSQVCTETKLVGYKKKTIYVTEIDGAKKLAYDAQIIQARRLQLQKDKAECGSEVVKMADSMFIDDNNIDPVKQDLTLERTKEVRQDLKDGILDRALRFANNVEIEGTLLSSYQKQYLISKIEECIAKNQ